MSQSMSVLMSASSAGLSDLNVYTIPSSQPTGQLQYFNGQGVSAYPITTMTNAEFALHEELQLLYTKLARNQTELLDAQRQLAQVIQTAQVWNQELQNCRQMLQDTRGELAQLKQQQNKKKMKKSFTPLQPAPEKSEQKAAIPLAQSTLNKKISSVSQKQWQRK